MKCDMCEWIKSAGLHPRYAAERMSGPGHTCKEITKMTLTEAFAMLPVDQQVKLVFGRASNVLFSIIAKAEAGEATVVADVIKQIDDLQAEPLMVALPDEDRQKLVALCASARKLVAMNDDEEDPT